MKDIQDQALGLQDQLMGSGESSPALIADHAAGLRELALTQYALGDNAEALAFARQARAAYMGIVAGAPGDANYVHRLVQADETIGDILSSQGERATARTAYEEAQAAVEAGVAHAITGVQVQRDRGRLLGKLSVVARLDHDVAAARKLARDGLNILNALGEPGPSDYDFRYELTLANRDLGDALLSGNDIDAATAAFEKAAATSNALAKDTPDNTLYLRDDTLSQERLAEALTAKNDLQGALKAYSAGEDTAIAMAAHDPANLGWQFDIAIGHREIGDTQLAMGDLPGAIISYRQAVAIDRVLVARTSSNASWDGHLWTMLFALGGALTQTGHDGVEALASFREARAWAESHESVTTPDDIWLMRVGRSIQAVGDSLLAAGDFEGAVQAYGDAASRVKTFMTKQPSNDIARIQYWVAETRLGDALTRRGHNTDAALAAYREAQVFAKTLADRETSGEDWLLSFLSSSRKVGDAWMASGDADNALGAYRPAVDAAGSRAAAPTASGALKMETFQTIAQLAGALALKRDTAGALSAYADAEELIRGYIAMTPNSAEARGQLGVLLVSAAHLNSSRQDYDKAIVELREGIELAKAASVQQPAQTLWIHELAIAHDDLGLALSDIGDWRGAVAEYRQKLEAEKQLPASDLSTPSRRVGDA